MNLSDEMDGLNFRVFIRDDRCFWTDRWVNNEWIPVPTWIDFNLDDFIAFHPQMRLSECGGYYFKTL